MPTSTRRAAILKGALILTAPGQATVATQAPAPAFPYSKENTHPTSWEELRKRLAPAAPILAEARQLLKSPISYENDLTFMRSTIPADLPMKLLSWLRADALLQIRDGNISQAIDDMETLSQAVLFMGAGRSPVAYAMELGAWHYRCGSNFQLGKQTTLTGVKSGFAKLSGKFLLRPPLANTQIVNQRAKPLSQLLRPRFHWKFPSDLLEIQSKSFTASPLTLQAERRWSSKMISIEM